MRRFRQTYYDYFSLVYDRFVALYSSDKQGILRSYLACKLQIARGGKILDLCTGTASLLPHLKNSTGNEGVVIGLDFFRGMLGVAKEKTASLKNVFLVQADAAQLPFKTAVFDGVTCSHAFYELKGGSQDMCLREIRRVLKQGRPFLMMEHDIPKNPLVRILFLPQALFYGCKKGATDIET